MKLKLFDRNTLIWTPLIMIGVSIVLNIILRWLRSQPELGYTFDIFYLWPMSVFGFTRPDWQDLLTLIGILIVWIGLLKAWLNKFSLKWLIVISIILIIGTNLFQGFVDGFASPTVGRDKYSVSYWNDIPKVQTVPHLIETYTLFQANLFDHSRVHPPGALLLHYLLFSIWPSPIFIGLVFMILGIISSNFIYDYLQNKISLQNAKLIAVLFLLLPAVQVFFLSSLDAVICTVFIASIWAWDKSNKIDTWFWITAGLMWLAFFLTFAAVILIPVVIVEDYRKNRSIRNVTKLGFTLGVMYWVFYLLSGFNYVQSLLYAKSFEGHGGFYLFEAPIEYLESRIQDVLLVLIFLGPFLAVLLYRALKAIKWKQFPVAVTPASILVAFLGFIIMGAYYTGETNRAALYLYPFIMIVIGLYLGKKKLSKKDQLFLLTSTFVQTVLWQLFGYHAF